MTVETAFMGDDDDGWGVDKPWRTMAQWRNGGRSTGMHVLSRVEEKITPKPIKL